MVTNQIKRKTSFLLILITINIFIINDIAFSCNSENSCLAATSRFNPIEINWNEKEGQYDIKIADKEFKKLQEVVSFKDDTSLLYLSLIIKQFLNKINILSLAGMSDEGREDHLEKIKESIIKNFPDAVKRFDRFHFKDMYWEGATVCLPYLCKDNIRVQRFRYFLPGMAEISYGDIIDIPGIDGVCVVSDTQYVEEGGDLSKGSLDERIKKFMSIKPPEIYDPMKEDRSFAFRQIVDRCEKSALTCGEYIKTAESIAQHLNPEQSIKLYSIVNNMEKNVRVYDVPAGGGHYGEFSYQFLMNPIKEIKNKIRFGPNIIDLYDVTLSTSGGNKAKSFMIFKKLGLRYPKGVLITIPSVNHIFNSNNEFIEDVARDIVNYFSHNKGDSAGKISLAIRSSPAKSMPGAFKTILEVECTKYAIEAALKEVADSWNSEKARSIRLHSDISYRDTWGYSRDPEMGIVVQKMVHGDYGKNSCSGVVFSRNQVSGESGIFGSYLPNKMGQYIMNADSKGYPIKEMSEKFPSQYQELRDALDRLEEAAGYPQEVEFAVEDGTLYFLQTRNMMLDPQAETRVLQEKASKVSTIVSVFDFQEKMGKYPVYKVKDQKLLPKPVFESTAYIGGAIIGKAAFDSSEVGYNSNSDNSVVFIAGQHNKDAVYFLSKIKKLGMILMSGDASSHPAVMVRARHSPAVIGCAGFEIRKKGYYGHILVSPDGKELISTEDEIAIVDGKVFIGADAIQAVRENMVMVDTLELLPYQIDAFKLREDIRNKFLSVSEDNIDWKVDYKTLLNLNAKKQDELRVFEASNDTKGVYVSNLEKHILHELLMERGKSIGKTEYQINVEHNLAIDVKMRPIDVWMNLERAQAAGFRDAVINETAFLKDNSQKTIIALGTGCIPGYQKGGDSSQHRDLSELILSVRKFCVQRGIPFIDKDESQLAKAISDKKEEEGFANARVVVLTSAGSIESIENELVRLGKVDNTTFLGVDGSELISDGYIRIMEMLRIAFNYAVNPDIPPASSNILLQKRGKFWVFLPKFEKITDDRRLIYKIQEFA